MKHKVIIIGGGIAGLCAAIGFQEIGIDVKVYERNEEPTVAGAGIIIAPNALQALKPYGIADQLIRSGKQSNGFRLLTDKGKAINQLTVPEKYQKMYSIHRKDLHHLLLSVLHPGTVEWGKHCTQVKQDDNDVHIQFSDGSETTGDILIAADGIHSVIRKQLFQNDDYRFAGYTCWRGVVSAENLSNMNDFIETWGTKGRFGIVPLPHHQIYWYALVNAAANDTHYSRYTAADLYHHFKDYHDPIPSLLKTTKDHQMIHRDIVDIVPMKQFFVQRILFIGDAAHAITPNMGQGACQSIEDARILAKCMQHHSDFHQAFVTYEAKRRKRIDKISNQSWMFGKVAQLDNPLLATLRNRFMKYTPQSMYLRQAHELYQFQG